MMLVRIVRVRMTQRRMRMRVHVRLGTCLPAIVIMLMVRVVDMQMVVGQMRMRVLMLVKLGEVQPEADHHKDPGANQLNRYRFAKEGNRD